MAINFPDNRDQLVPPQPSGPIQTGDVYVFNGTTYVATVLSDGSVRWDAAVSAGSDAYVLKVGDTMTGQLTLPGGGTGSEAATVDQITSAIPAALWQRDGGTSTLSPATANDNLDQGTGDISGGNIQASGFTNALGGSYSRTGDTNNKLFIGQQTDFTEVFSVSNTGNVVAAGDVQTTSLNTAGLDRNQLINPNFTVQQRGTSFSAPADVYTADRWWMGNAAGRNVDFTSDGPYQNAMRITNNASDNVFLRQGIEIQQGKCGPFTLNSVWTLSLWSDSTDWVGRNLGVAAFRDAGKMNDASGQAGVTATAFAATGETSSGMSRYALQVTIDASPAATHSMLCLGLSLPTGGHRISAVQFEPGSVATPYLARPVQTELALCQRYYFRTGGNCYGTSGVAANKNVAFPFLFPATMRATPTTARENTGNGPRFTDASSTGVTLQPDAQDYFSGKWNADAEL